MLPAEARLMILALPLKGGSTFSEGPGPASQDFQPVVCQHGEGRRTRRCARGGAQPPRRVHGESGEDQGQRSWRPCFTRRGHAVVAFHSRTPDGGGRPEVQTDLCGPAGDGNARVYRIRAVHFRRHQEQDDPMLAMPPILTSRVSGTRDHRHRRHHHRLPSWASKPRRDAGFGTRRNSISPVIGSP